MFALARVFSALAAMDIGTSFGGLGARREMMIGFLAEPAMLMTLFTAAFISGSTQLTTIVDTLAHREFALYPSLAFAAVAFLMVLLAENARIPIDNPDHSPRTHHDPRGDDPRVFGAPPGAHRVGRRHQAVRLHDHRHRPVRPLGHRSGGRLERRCRLAVGALAAKLALAGAGLALIETLLAKLRLLLAPEFLSTAFLLGVLGMLTHFLVHG